MKKKSSVIAKLIIPVAVLGCIAIMIAGVSLYSMTAVQKESNQISGEGVRATKMCIRDRIVVGIVVIVIGIAIACILDRDAGAYECPECKTRFVPEMGAYVMGPHTLTRRKLVCPHCGAHRYCKKVLTR